MQLSLTRILLLTLLGLASELVAADEVAVAVAANFTAPMQQIAIEFHKDTGHTAQLSFGSTGKFYAQISSGAPFEVLLAADRETPSRLVSEGKAVAASQFTYAIGKLVLWSAKPGVVDQKGSVLTNSAIAHIAYCNPKLAPYGAAAVEAMKSLGVLDAVQPKLVQGESIAQAFQFVASGNAEIGFIALSQVIKDGKIPDGSSWILPSNLYSPIRQDAVILDKGRDRPAAKALIDYLKSDKSKAIIRSFGYDL
ncbi:MAG TPA: molybdate ABC transporter substrate-binding protein [Burkholderiaceae bacterium]|jgi:molybdate transport system substrate-binding protein|nr:molybdate ABC transporter substrate-binding protein [Burkholderiaceae bacterium]